MQEEKIYLGIDGGASKLLFQTIKIVKNSRYAHTGEYCKEISYKDFEGWDNSFEPEKVETQKIFSKKNKFFLSTKETNQGKVIIKIIEKFYKIAVRDIGTICGVGLCFPGIKTPDLRGTIIMANGPRIPNLCEQLNKKNIAVDILYNDSDCCVTGEMFWENGSLKNASNAIYIGGGTGIADGIVINGNIVNFNSDSNLKKSWELILPSGKTVESSLSPKFLIKNYNSLNPKNHINTLDEIILQADNKNSYAIKIIDEAVKALHFLIDNRLKYINDKTGENCQKIVIGQRLGLSLSLKKGENSFMKTILSEKKHRVPINISIERKTAAIGAAWKSFC